MTEAFNSKHSQRDLDKKKYGSDTDGKIASNVNDSTAMPMGTDYIGITYPTTTTEVYVYKTGGSGGTTLRTITLTYLTASKNDLSSVEYS